MRPSVIDIRFVQDYLLELEFADGTRKELNLQGLLELSSGPLSELKNLDFFSRVQLDPARQVGVWPNGVELDLTYSNEQELQMRYPVDEQHNPGLRILRLMSELKQMPEFELLQQLQGFDVSLYTFDQNFQDLREVIVALTEGPQAAELLRLRNRDKQQAIMVDIIRRLHNFVASAQSLVDHTRNLWRKYYETNGRFRDYEAKKDETFVNDSLAQFVQNLRQYCQHYRSPNISITTSTNGQVIRKVNLLIDDLNSFDRWNSQARDFLNSIEKEVDILEIAASYRTKVTEFYVWFRARQAEIHAEEIQRFRKKEDELLLAMLDQKLDLYIADIGKTSNVDEVFINIFASREFAELDTLPPDSVNRASRAIELLEKRFVLLEEMKQKIFRLYYERSLSSHTAS